MSRKTFGSAVLMCAGLAALLAGSLRAMAWEREPFSNYHERRERLVRETGDGIVVLFGFAEKDVAASTTPFRQNENFYYLTGWMEPDAILMLVPKPARSPGNHQGAVIDKEILFIPAHDYRMEKWTGPKLGPDDADASARSGFPIVKRTSLFPAELTEALKTFPKVYTELTPQPESGEDSFLQETISKLRGLAPLATFNDIRHIFAQMRMIKTPEEIALMRKATEASIEAHLAAMKTLRPGAWEYELAARMKYEYERLGCEWPAYPPIVGSGFFSTVLHYDQNWNQMQDGDVVVIDVGGAYGAYATDITRTLPINGRFTKRQREIYEVVLGGQNAALAAARPGITTGRGGGGKSLHQIAYDYINSHGKDLHGQPLGQYFIHGLSHSVGLNVHDPAESNQPLQPGMVITIEPGVYIAEEKLGVRIEDMVLITKDGAELLTRRLPRDPDEIEKVMSQR